MVINRHIKLVGKELAGYDNIKITLRNDNISYFSELTMVVSKNSKFFDMPLGTTVDIKVSFDD